MKNQQNKQATIKINGKIVSEIENTSTDELNSLILLGKALGFKVNVS